MDTPRQIQREAKFRRHLLASWSLAAATLVTACSSSPAVAPLLDAGQVLAPEPRLDEDVAQQAQARIDRGFHLGTVIGIVDDHGSRYFGFGRVSPAGSEVPDAHTIFEIGSVTKTFTATLLAVLDLRDEIDLDSRVEAHVPSFREVEVIGSVPITMESLVTHTSGLPREPPNVDPNDDDRYATYSPQDLEDVLSQGALTATPGEYAYSNFGVLLLEQALESAMSSDYETLLQTRVLTPLGLRDTHLVVPPDSRDRLATGFRDGVTTTALDVGLFPAMGGLRSTATDMLTYLAAQIGRESTSLDEAIRATHRLRLADPEHAMALGWHVLEREASKKTILFHKGGTNGFVSFAGFDLENRRGVVVLVNGTRWFSDLGFHLLDPSYPLADPLAE